MFQCAQHIESAEDMGHRGIAAIKHHIRVADGCQIAGTVNEQERNVQIRFEQAVDQPTCGVALSCVDQDAADKLTCHHDGSGTPAVVNGSDIVGLKTEREGRSGEQFSVGAVEQDGLLRSHGA
jgi:hypothetical protein